MATMSDEFSELEEEFPEEEFPEFEEVDIAFVSEDFISNVVENVETVILNTEISSSKVKAKVTTKDRNLPALVMFKSLNELCLKQIMVDAVVMLENDQIYFVGSQSKTRKEELESLKILLGGESITDDIKTIVTEIFKIAEVFTKSVFISDGKNSVWKKFYNMLQDRESLLNTIWNNTITNFKNIDLVKYKLCSNILQIFIKQNIKSNENNIYEQEKISEREQNIIRFISGYIPHTMLKHYKKYEKNNRAKYITTLLSLFSRKSSSEHYLQTTNIWIDCCNRGGLFEVSDSAFIFVRSLEYAIREVFNTNYLRKYEGENLKELLIENILKNRRVLNNWDQLTKEIDVDEEIKKFVFKRFALYWINIRGNAFIKSWIDQKKKDFQKLSRKGEHSLRKELK